MRGATITNSTVNKVVSSVNYTIKLTIEGIKVMKSICFTIALNGYAHTFRDCISSQRTYCREQHFELWTIKSLPWRITSRQCAWLKVEIMRGLLSAGVDSIAFIDADCEIRPHTPDFNGTFEDNQMMMARGKSGRLNSGVIFARNDDRVIAFLDRLISESDNSVSTEDATLYENGHFIRYSRDVDFIGSLSHKQWNNNSILDPDSFIQHYSGGELRRHHKLVRQNPRDRALDFFANSASNLRSRLKPDIINQPISEFLAIARDHFEPQYSKLSES